MSWRPLSGNDVFCLSVCLFCFPFEHQRGMLAMLKLLWGQDREQGGTTYFVVFSTAHLMSNESWLPRRTAGKQRGTWAPCKELTAPRGTHTIVNRRDSETCLSRGRRAASLFTEKETHPGDSGRWPSMWQMPQVELGFNTCASFSGWQMCCSLQNIFFFPYETF